MPPILTEIVDGIEYIEEWKPIEGYEDLYWVSSFGRFWKCKKGKRSKAKLIKGVVDGQGYIFVALYRCNVRNTQKAHRLVAKTFIPNPENKPQVNHKKGIRSDNRVHQLEWSTSSENVIHSFKVLGKVPTGKGKFGGLHHSAKKVRCENFGLTFLSLRDAANVIGYRPLHIGYLCRTGKTCKFGLSFSYIK